MQKMEIDLTPMNPLPSGAAGAKLLRQLHNCPIAQYATTLDRLLKAALQERDAKGVERLSSFLSSIMVADIACEQNTSKRVAVDFKDTDDLKLTGLTRQLQELHESGNALYAQLKEIEQKYQELEKERFAYAAQTYGLNLKSRLHTVDEEAGTISEVHADCNNCSPKQFLEVCLNIPQNPQL